MDVSVDDECNRLRHDTNDVRTCIYVSRMDVDVGRCMRCDPHDVNCCMTR